MSEYLEVPTGLLHFRDYGGSGRTLVLVHGLGGSIANWDQLGPRLRSRGHVIAIDLPGFGLSPPGRDWSLETHAGAIIETVERMGPPAVLVGNSLGGLLCELVAARRPDLVDALVLICPATPPRLPDPDIHWPIARRLLVSAIPVIGPAISRQLIASMSPRELVNDSLRRITHKPGRVPLEMVESFVKVAETRTHLPWAVDAIPKTGQAIRSLFLRRSAFVAMIRDVRAPTLVIQGVDDPIVSKNSVHWLCSLRPDWVLVEMDDTGHTPQIDAGIRTLSIIDPWLAEARKQAIAV